MKRSISFIVMLLSCTRPAFASDCINLSHVQQLGGFPLQVSQVGCEKWVREQHIDGQPSGIKSEIVFSDDWSTSKVDDDYESTANQQRWAWNADKTIILHEFHIVSFSKDSREKVLRAGSESFQLSNDQIVLQGQMLIRIEKSDGSVSISSSPKNAAYPRLNP